jgi:ADP-ribose pyrophosphatase YjhB (NUDIX family)
MSPRAYPTRPLVGIGVAVLRGDAVLLARRGRPPAMGAWSLPGGAQKLGESVEAAARRELAEETGLRVGALAAVLCAGGLCRQHPPRCGGRDRIPLHHPRLCRPLGG